MPGLKKIASKLPTIGVGTQLAKMELGIPSVTVSDLAIDKATGKLAAASPSALTEDNRVLDIDLNLGLQNLNVSAGPLSITVTPLNFAIGPEIYMVQTVSIVPVNIVTYTFDIPVSGSIQRVGQASPQRFTNYRTLTAAEGDQVDLDFFGRPFNVSSAWTFQAKMTNDIDLVIDVSGNLTAGDLEVDLDLPGWIKEIIGLPFDPPPLLRMNDVVKIDIAKFDVFDKTFDVISTTGNAKDFRIGQNFVFDYNVTSFTEGSGSLRNAIISANAANSLDPSETREIFLDAGTYGLSLIGTNEDAAATGDLDITHGTVRIVGRGEGITVIDADAIDRVFDVRPGGTLILENLTVTGGKAATGGGIQVLKKLETSNVTIEGNTGTTAGGAVYFNTPESSSKIQVSTLRNNSAPTGGAIAGSNEGSITVSQSTVSGNSAATAGAGIHLGGIAKATITSSTISGNSSGEAALFVADDARATVYSGTIADNTGIEGIRVRDFGRLIIAETIVANHAADVVRVGADVLIVDQGFNLVETTAVTGWAASTIRSMDPVLSVLGNNGGTTQTHRLQSGSPAISGGDPNSTRPDQRILGFDLPTGGRDIGATQFFDTVTIPVANPDGVRLAASYFQIQGGKNTIQLEAGVYAPSRGSAILPNIQVLAGGDLTIVGVGKDATVIDGSRLRFRVMQVDQGALTLRDLQITGGTAPALTGDASGGGVFNNNGQLTLERVSIANNFGAYGAGGILSAGTTKITDSLITGNRSTLDGGGITIQSGTTTITNSIISGNVAASPLAPHIVNSPSSIRGGGIHQTGGILTVESSLILGNIAQGPIGENYPGSSLDGLNGLGGGVSILNGIQTTIRNTTISGNSALGGAGIGVLGHFTLGDIATDGGDGLGGGIHTGNSPVTLDSVTVFGNVAAPGPGGKLYSNGVLLAEGTGGGSGTGGIHDPNGTIQIRNSVIANNGSNAALRSFADFELALS